MHDQRSPDLSQTESICGSFGDSVACFAQADAGIVRDEVLHATGMVSSVFVDYCVLFLALMIPEFVQFFLGGQDKKHVGRSSSRSSTRLRTLTKSYKIQVSGSALGKTIKSNACRVVIFTH